MTAPSPISIIRLPSRQKRDSPHDVDTRRMNSNPGESLYLEIASAHLQRAVVCARPVLRKNTGITMSSTTRSPSPPVCSLLAIHTQLPEDRNAQLLRFTAR